MSIILRCLWGLSLFVLIGNVNAFAQQQDFSKVKIKPLKVRDNIYMLTGSGGNLGISVGEDGVFLIDDQFAPLTEKIKAAIGKISNKPIRFVINTHWHFDHTGGNENLGKEGIVIVAHDNVRERMSKDQFIAAFNMKIPTAPKVALPVVTFSETATFHMNDETLSVQHVPTAHTDGDAFVIFKKGNVVHTGDLYFSGMYPFIDAGSGGSIEGVIKAVNKIIDITDKDTKVIPGHGPLSDQAALIKYRDMLKEVHKEVSALIAQGKSREDVIAAKPTSKFDAEWGKGFLKPDAFVGIVYDGLQK